MFLAQTGTSSSSPLGLILMFVVLFGLMYVMFIRPQSKRRKEAAQMQSKLGPGDEIMTIGGLYGTVVTADDESVTLEISDGVTARYSRQAVARVTSQKSEPSEPITSPVDGGDQQ